ncbi:MAG: AAA family ATPase, partial [Proteobacteria bacterium]|nr:AAA family ATPase [Pseudomonadota bacterium]
MMNEQDRAASALMHLDSSCPREEWIKAGMAAKAAGLGFDCFHTWSATADNYAGEGDCRNVWKSFGDSGRVTPATLYAMAFAQGWQDPAKRQQAVNGARVGITHAAPRKAPVTPINTGDYGKAFDMWNRCEPAPANHAYIARKGGLPDGLRIYPHDAPPLVIRGQNVAGWLVLPCRDLAGNLQTVQFIPEHGDKLNLPGASFGNGCHVVGEIGDRVYIVEGIGQAWAVHAATNAAAVVCFGAGRMATVAAAIREQFPAARLVLVPDCGKETQAAEIARAVKGAWCELPADKPANYDANDYAIEHGTDALGDLLGHTKEPPMRFKLLSGAELSNAPPMRWMVRGVLPLEGLAALYGPSGSGKSFLVLDISTAVAGAACDWFGRRVSHCPVTYCALEGEAGMGKRIAAWSLHHNKPVPYGLRFITQAFDLLDGDDVAELGKAIQAAGGAGGLMILDTLNRAAPGADENSSVDMGNIIAAAKRLQSITGGLVLLVHHTGKDETKGLRGHSSLYAALDGAIKVTKTDTRREWSIDKSKEDETGAAHAFKLEVVPLGFDDEGDEITSCIAVPDDSKERVSRVKLPQGGNQLLALKALTEPFSQSRDFNKPGAIPGRPCIELEAAVMAIADSLTCEPKRKNERARKALSG